MSGIAPIAPIDGDPSFALQPLARAALGTDAVGASHAQFGTMISQGITQVNEQLRAGEASLQRLATGDTANLHQVMIQLEESRLAFQLMMQVRGKLLEAYQEVMKMQV